MAIAIMIVGIVILLLIPTSMYKKVLYKIKEIIVKIKKKW